MYVAVGAVQPTPDRWIAPTLTETPLTNPPGFRWQDRGADAYDLQISRKSAFQSEETLSVESWPLTIFTPDRALEPGIWYWRVRSRHGERVSSWSTPIAFEITEALPQVLVPSIPEIIDRLVQGGRPRLFLTRASIPQWQQRIRTTHRAIWSQIAAEASLATLVNVEEPPWREGTTDTDPETVEDYREAVRRATALSESIQLLGLSYLLTGNERHGQAAREKLMALARWDPDGATNVFKNDTAFREVVVGLARGYDWLAATDVLSEEDKRLIAWAARIRGEDFAAWYRSKTAHARWPYESHQSGGLVNFAELALAFAGELDESKEWLRYTIHMLTANYPAYGRSDGSWSEGPEYWSHTMGRHLPSLWAISQALDVDLTAHPFLRNTGYYLLYTTPPWSRFFPFGDHHQDRVGEAYARNMQLLAGMYDNPHFAWYAQTPPLSGGLEMTAVGFLTFQRGLRGVPPNDLPLARAFPDTGLAVMRTDLVNPEQDIQFMIKASPFGSVSHAHADQGNFTLTAFGEPLVIPSGYYPLYGDEHHTTWTRQSWAHNVPIMAGKGQATRTPLALGQIEHFFHSQNRLVDYVRVEAGRAYSAQTPASAARELDRFVPGLSAKTGSAPVDRYRRHVVFVRPSVFVVLDEVEASEPVHFEWLLHTVNMADLDPVNHGLRVANNEARLAVTFVSPNDLELRQDDAFTSPPTGRHASRPKQWHITVRTVGAFASHRFKSILVPHREGESVPTAIGVDHDGWDGVTLESGDERTTVAFRKGMDRTADTQGELGEIQVGSVRADADVLVVREGESAWLYASMARRLQVEERPATSGEGGLPAGVWEFEEPVDVTIYRLDGEYVVTVDSRQS